MAVRHQLSAIRWRRPAHVPIFSCLIRLPLGDYHSTEKDRHAKWKQENLG
jgi:hypothetical protein